MVQKSWTAGEAPLTKPPHECLPLQQSTVLCRLVVLDSRLAVHQP